MKISGRKPVSRTTPASGAARPAGKAKADAAAKVSPSSANVELSESILEIDRAHAVLAAMPDMRVERVEEIKPRVDDGSYRIESKIVAKKMVDASLRESATGKPAKGN